MITKVFGKTEEFHPEPDEYWGQNECSYCGGLGIDEYDQTCHHCSEAYDAN